MVTLKHSMSYTLKNYENIKSSLNLVHKVDLVLALSIQLCLMKKEEVAASFFYNKNVIIVMLIMA